MNDILELPAQLTIAEVTLFRERLVRLLKTRAEILMDGTNVAVADTAGIQLLAAFCREAADRSVQVRWRSAGDSLAQAAALLGLTVQLGMNTTSNPET